MKKKLPKPVRFDMNEFDDFESKNGEILCEYAIRYYFDLPPRTETIWVSFFDRPGKDRLKVTVPESAWPGLDMPEGEGELTFFVTSTQMFIDDNFKPGQTFYVKIEYLG